jgi:hypothetical protein
VPGEVHPETCAAIKHAKPCAPIDYARIGEALRADASAYPPRYKREYEKAAKLCAAWPMVVRLQLVIDAYGDHLPPDVCDAAKRVREAIK